jgi:hypothetical protein
MSFGFERWAPVQKTLLDTYGPPDLFTPEVLAASQASPGRLMASQVTPEEAEVALRAAIVKTYVQGTQAQPPTPSEALEVQEAIDDIIAHLDLKTMDEADFQVLCGELGLEVGRALQAKKPGVRVHDMEGR